MKWHALAGKSRTTESKCAEKNAAACDVSNEKRGRLRVVCRLHHSIEGKYMPLSSFMLTAAAFAVKWLYSGHVTTCDPVQYRPTQIPRRSAFQVLPGRRTDQSLANVLRAAEHEANS